MVLQNAGSNPATSTKGITMDYQNKKKFKRAKKKQRAKAAKVAKRRESLREEATVERLLQKIRYDSRERIKPKRNKDE
jgi:hypothetical protein